MASAAAAAAPRAAALPGAPAGQAPARGAISRPSDACAASDRHPPRRRTPVAALGPPGVRAPGLLLGLGTGSLGHLYRRGFLRRSVPGHAVDLGRLRLARHDHRRGRPARSLPRPVGRCPELLSGHLFPLLSDAYFTPGLIITRADDAAGLS